MVHQITSAEEYRATLQSNKVVVVDFFATWCGPCKMIAPKFERFSEEYGTKAMFIKVDVDELPDIARTAEVTAMPSFHVYVSGKRVAEIVGARPADLEAAIKTHAV